MLRFELFLLGCSLSSATLGSFNFLDLLLNACQLRINHDTSAVLANDDFLMHADIQLTLRRNLVEATAA